VPDRALRTAADIVGHMLSHRSDIRAKLVEARVRVAVMASRESTLDIPEHRDLTPKSHWNRRARGLGATPWRPASSCAEENLLGYPDDPYRGECILIHEFAHTIHVMGLTAIDTTFDGRLSRLHERAVRSGRWRDTYAATNHAEYWAEGVQSWFDANRTARRPDGVHNHVGTRAALNDYDPDLAKLIAEVFRDDPWRWVRTGAHRP
jgi:hypothetical protein